MSAIVITAACSNAGPISTADAAAYISAQIRKFVRDLQHDGYTVSVATLDTVDVLATL